MTEFTTITTPQGYPVAQQELRRTALLDDLAKLEHEQWREWAYNIVDQENISEARCKRWLNIFNRPYHQLTEEEKYKDYEYAERVLFVVKKHLGIR